MAGGGGGTEELNLVPYLDIMINLIMFMVTITAFLAYLKEAPLIAPTLASGGAGGGEQKPFLSLAIVQAGVNILGGGGSGGKQFVKKGDYAGITARLHQLKVEIPELSETLVVSADGRIAYSEVVKVLDAARADFPQVTLGAVVPQ